MQLQHLQAKQSILQQCGGRRTFVCGLSCGMGDHRCSSGTGVYSALGHYMMVCVLYLSGSVDEPLVGFIECA